MKSIKEEVTVENLIKDGCWAPAEIPEFRRKIRLGRHKYVRLKLRCINCWGDVHHHLIGNVVKDAKVTAIQCQVCGLMLREEDAKHETDRFYEELHNNLERVVQNDLEPTYHGPYLWKIFPYNDKDLLSKGEFDQRINDSRSIETKTKDKGKLLTRKEFPRGSVALLCLQAGLLIGAVNQLTHNAKSILNYEDIKLTEDNKFSISGIRAYHVIRTNPKYFDWRNQRRAGATLTVAFNSAFACELLTKAILLVTKNQAPKIHSLKTLWKKIPERSRRRMQSDYPEIEETLISNDQVFGKWRYFEDEVTDHALKLVVDDTRAHALAKSARVLLDETEVLSLTWKINILGNIQCNKATMNFDGWESLPRKEIPLE